MLESEGPTPNFADIGSIAGWEMGGLGGGCLCVDGLGLVLLCWCGCERGGLGRRGVVMGRTLILVESDSGL